MKINNTLSLYDKNDSTEIVFEKEEDIIELLKNITYLLQKSKNSKEIITSDKHNLILKKKF